MQMQKVALKLPISIKNVEVNTTSSGELVILVNLLSTSERIYSVSMLYTSIHEFWYVVKARSNTRLIISCSVWVNSRPSVFILVVCPSPPKSVSTTINTSSGEKENKQLPRKGLR